MALPYTHTGGFTRSAGIYSALAKQAKLLNLKPAKRIVFTYDPFGENVTAIRNSQIYFSQGRIQDTNPKCIVKTNIICTRAEPEINVVLETGHKLSVKTKNLSSLEILKLFNQFVSSQYKPEEQATVVKQTKAEKKKKK